MAQPPHQCRHVQSESCPKHLLVDPRSASLTLSLLLVRLPNSWYEFHSLDLPINLHSAQSPNTFSCEATNKSSPMSSRVKRGIEHENVIIWVKKTINYITVYINFLLRHETRLGLTWCAKTSSRKSVPRFACDKDCLLLQGAQIIRCCSILNSQTTNTSNVQLDIRDTDKVLQKDGDKEGI